MLSAYVQHLPATSSSAAVAFAIRLQQWRSHHLTLPPDIVSRDANHPFSDRYSTIDNVLIQEQVIRSS